MDKVDTIIRGIGDAISAVETEIQEQKFPKPDITDEDPTRRVIKEMLVENTGCHILDSGGAYGRHWQRNRKIDFDKRPRATYEVWLDESHDRTPLELIVEVDIYHYLTSVLSYTEKSQKLEREFYKFAEELDECWLECMEQWVDKLYGGRNRYDICAINTYNYEYDLLSQIIQYIAFSVDMVDYVLLQIHNGCDVRGGYTAPRLFEGGPIFCDSAYLYCPECNYYLEYRSEDGYSEMDEEHPWYELYKFIKDVEKGTVWDSFYILCPRCYKKDKEIKLEADFFEWEV